MTIREMRVLVERVIELLGHDDEASFREALELCERIATDKIDPPKPRPN